MSDNSGTALEQSSLTGEDVERAECEYLDGCTNPAVYRGELLVHDGGGYAQEETLLCHTCTDEFTEPGTGNSVEEDLERLKPSERYVSDEEPETIWIVAGNYADDPHPHILGVFEDEEPAEELMDDCRQTVGGPHPVAWQKFEREVL